MATGEHAKMISAVFIKLCTKHECDSHTGQEVVYENSLSNTYFQVPPGSRIM